MSSILSVHGWLDIYDQDLVKVKVLLNGFKNRIYPNDASEIINALINGWCFQLEPLNGIITIFYGRITKGTNLLFIENMMQEIILCCKNANGCFVFQDNEEEYSNNWRIVDGKIIDATASDD